MSLSGRLHASVLFSAAAAVVFWHAARVTVLWDITYALEIAHRITLGELPYRDFVVPQGPVTFLIQTAIHLPGWGVWPHLAYCAIAAGLTVALTYRLVRLQLEGLDPEVATYAAFALTAPVVFLNGYAILPLPFYDPDCAFFVVLALAAVLWARSANAGWRHVIAGALVVVPLFVKQNIGVAAFLSIHGFLLLAALRNRAERRAHLLVVTGSVATLVAAITILHLTVGLQPYYHWTVQYAAARRWPSANLLLSLYGQPRTWAAVTAVLVGYVVVERGRSLPATLAGLAVMAVPWVDATRTMVRWGFAARSYALWGIAAVTAVLAGLAAVRARDWRFERAVPLMAIAVVHGAFASQGVHDSSYAVWPFLPIALAWPAARLLVAAREQQRLAARSLALGAAVLTALGYLHITRHERLRFADLSGAVERATHPRLRGLATPGSYMSDFERLLARCDELIPAGDAVLLMPGEDPYFFASGRRPRFPVVLFDDTAAPYDRETVGRMLEERDIKWIIVKTRLQLLNRPWQHLDAFVSADVPSRYALVEELPRYKIFKKR